jgi:hypothetical protein
MSRKNNTTNICYENVTKKSCYNKCMKIHLIFFLFLINLISSQDEVVHTMDENKILRRIRHPFITVINFFIRFYIKLLNSI